MDFRESDEPDIQMIRKIPSYHLGSLANVTRETSSGTVGLREGNNGNSISLAQSWDKNSETLYDLITCNLNTISSFCLKVIPTIPFD